MYRNELKYVIDYGTAEIISSRLKQFCDYDSNCNEEGFYQVSSLYFDDYCNSSLNDNIVGRSDRKKYRIRIYNGSDEYIRLEKKIKHNKGGIKESCAITTEQYQLILDGDYKNLRLTSKDKLLSGFCLEYAMRGLSPKVIVDYKRKSFTYQFGDVRVTMDYNIKHSSVSHDLFSSNVVYIPATEENQIVLEVKFTGFLPKVIKNLVQQSKVPQTGFSKYSTSRYCFR